MIGSKGNAIGNAMGGNSPSVTGSGGGGPTTTGNFAVGPNFGNPQELTTRSALNLSALGLSAIVRTQSAFTNPANRIVFTGPWTSGSHMSGSVLGAPFYQSAGTVATTTSANSVDIPKPSGLAVGDFMLATLGFGLASTWTTPSGWTQILNTFTNFGVAAFWKFADSSDVAASTFTFTSGQSQSYVAGIHRMIGVNTTTPVNASATGSGSGTSCTAPAVTTTVANTRVFVGVATNSFTGVTFTPPSGFTERYDLSATNLALSAVCSCADEKPINATGSTGTFSIATSSVTSVFYDTFTIAIAPGPVTIAT